ncbi:MAG: phosphoribosylamine--glycine ligase [Thermodesulfobacteriota bacterium]
MRILVVGGGGREHALCWKINNSPLVEKIYCAPGNAGISKIAECVDIPVTEIYKLLLFAKNNSIDLTVVGPELPLTLGIVDLFEKENLKIFGPSKAASELEGSKIFSKKLMDKYGIPTAKYNTFTEAAPALNYIKEINPPFVVKADGLAAGKGVVICNTILEGEEAVNSIMSEKVFGDAGNSILIEEFLVGQEASIFVFTDGVDFLLLESSQDHKAIFDDDKGPNTGGMGAYCPAPIVDKELLETIVDKVIKPTIEGLNSEAKKYKGVLYIGLMINGEDVKVLEYNCRFGDPEAQPLLFKMESDIVPLMNEIAEGKLKQKDVLWKAGSAVCVVMSSRGYPGKYNKGVELTKLGELVNNEDVVVFHAGTKFENGKIVTNGGRVLGVTCIGQTIEETITKVYESVNIIDEGNLYFRSDIGRKAVTNI